jgi:hypothetical protein
MMYFECDKDYYLVWPVLALSIRGEFWIEIGWLNCVCGWRAGDDGDKYYAKETP